VVIEKSSNNLVASNTHNQLLLNNYAYIILLTGIHALINKIPCQNGHSYLDTVDDKKSIPVFRLIKL